MNQNTLRITRPSIQLYPTMTFFWKIVLLLLMFTVSGKCNNKVRNSNEKPSVGDTEVEEGANDASGNVTRNYVSQNVKSKKVSCAKDNINEMSRSVRCKPRLTVVELVSSETKSRFVPNAVLAKRCSGSCDGFQRCVPTKSINTTFFVKETVKNKSYCSAVEVLEDKECVCECLLKPKDCSPYQRYSSNTCSCRCNDDVENRKCKTSVSKNLEWNDRKCACECVGSQPCSNGLEWDLNKCRCAKGSR